MKFSPFLHSTKDSGYSTFECENLDQLFPPPPPPPGIPGLVFCCGAKVIPFKDSKGNFTLPFPTKRLYPGFCALTGLFLFCPSLKKQKNRDPPRYPRLSFLRTDKPPQSVPDLLDTLKAKPFPYNIPSHKGVPHIFSLVSKVMVVFFATECPDEIPPCFLVSPPASFGSMFPLVNLHFPPDVPTSSSWSPSPCSTNITLLAAISRPEPTVDSRIFLFHLLNRPATTRTPIFLVGTRALNSEPPSQNIIVLR